MSMQKQDLMRIQETSVSLKNESVVITVAEKQPRLSPLATNFAGVSAGILILLLIFTFVPRLT